MQVSTCSNGKYKLNQENVFISLPVELGDQGVKRIVEIDLDETEQQKVTNLCGLNTHALPLDCPYIFMENFSLMEFQKTYFRFKRRFQ